MPLARVRKRVELTRATAGALARSSALLHRPCVLVLVVHGYVPSRPTAATPVKVVMLAQWRCLRRGHDVAIVIVLPSRLVHSLL